MKKTKKDNSTNSIKTLKDENELVEKNKTRRKNSGMKEKLII